MMQYLSIPKLCSYWIIKNNENKYSRVQLKKQNITNTIKTKSVLIPFHPILGLS